VSQQTIAVSKGSHRVQTKIFSSGGTTVEAYQLDYRLYNP